MAPDGIVISPYQPEDLEGVVGLLNRELHADPTTGEIFQRRVLLDLNFRPEGAPVARDGHRIVGFMVGMVRTYTMEDQIPDFDRGYISLAAVDRDYQRRGIGTRLWEHVKAYFQSRDVKSALAATYAPNYFFPGVDLVAYAGAVKFFEKHGFATPVTVLSMDASLVNLQTPDWIKEKESKLLSEGVGISALKPEHILPLLDHLRECFPGDWQRHIRDSMVRKTFGTFNGEIYVAMSGGKCLGFCQHDGECFGPFGVDDKVRGRGIGAVLLLRCLHGMRAKGFRNAWFASTTDDAARIYAAGGFKETRRFAVMKTSL